MQTGVRDLMWGLVPTAAFEDKDTSHEVRNVGTLEAGKGKQMDSLLDPPERKAASLTELDFSSAKRMSDFWSNKTVR